MATHTPARHPAHQVDVDVMEALQDVLQIPAEVLPWLKKMERASHADHPAALQSSQMLFTDLHEVCQPISPFVAAVRTAAG